MSKAETKVVEEEEEEEEEDVGDEEEEDEMEVYLGLASKVAVEDDVIQAKFMGVSANTASAPGMHDCLVCKHATPSVVEFFVVNAPFGDLASREIILCVCQKCEAISAKRRQTAAGGEELSKKPEVEKDTPQPPPLFAESSSPSEQLATSMDDLAALLLASSTANSNKSKQQASKTSAKKKAASAPQDTLLHIAFSLEPGLEEEDFSHEAALLEKYNKEARELGEEPVANVRNAVTAKAATLSFESFIERLSREPRQLLRYSYGNVPLMPSKAAPSPPKCEACGAPRRFEFQLTPQAVGEVQRFSKTQVTFSTIIVYSCEASCDAGSQEYSLVCAEL